MSFWIKHPRSDQEDTMLTVAIASVAVVLFKFLISGVTLGTTNLGTIDGLTIAAVLTPTLGAYVARKYKDSPDKKE